MLTAARNLEMGDAQLLLINESAQTMNWPDDVMTRQIRNIRGKLLNSADKIVLVCAGLRSISILRELLQ